MRMRTHAATFESNINVTPLVDVCLVLLIIFMVVTPIINGDIPVHLPKTANGERLAPEQLKITVNADGTVYVGAAALRAEQVASELHVMYEKEPLRPVAVRGDKSVAYGEVVKVLDAARAAGYRDVALVSDSLSRDQVR
jgi:biopolymer transport protein ExbD